ncbi:MAG: MauE/DoxX family redox-associated membrane protein, partial [Candidatus Dormibacteraceae bacterium]
MSHGQLSDGIASVSLASGWVLICAVLTVCQLVLGVVLLTAASGKILRSEEFTSALRLSKLPRTTVTPVAGLVVAFELLGTLVLLEGTRQLLLLGFGGAIALLAAFTAWLAWMNRNGLNVECGCFGPNSSKVSRRSIARNTALLIVATSGATLAAISKSLLPSASLQMTILVTCVGLIYILAAGFLRARSELVLSLGKVLASRRSDDNGG